MWRRVIFHEKANKNKKKKIAVQYIYVVSDLQHIKSGCSCPIFEVECEEGKVISAVCKYCPEGEYNAYMHKLKPETSRTPH